MTAAAAVREAEARLAAAGCASPRVDAEHLVAHVLEATRTDLYAHGERRLTQDERSRFDALLERREAREPLAYILGHWGFRRLTLAVDRRVLVPRPETEIVVERCLALLRGMGAPDVLDVGVGSGAIALAIADEHPSARVTAFDNSPDALAVARANAAGLGMDGRVRFIEHDLTSGLGERRWDLVVSNPPYVRPEELARLEPEVRDWEPRSALVGTGFTEALGRAALRALRPGRPLVLEVADGAGSAVAGMLSTLGYERIAVTPDLAGRERIVEGCCPM